MVSLRRCIDIHSRTYAGQVRPKAIPGLPCLPVSYSASCKPWLPKLDRKSTMRLYCHPVRVAFKIWAQLGSSNASLGFFSALKLAVSAAGFQSVTVQVRLDTVEVRGSSPLVPTISSLDSVPSREPNRERYRSSSPNGRISAFV